MLIFFGSGRGGYIYVVRHFQGQVLECWPESFFFLLVFFTKSHSRKPFLQSLTRIFLWMYFWNLDQQFDTFTSNFQAQENIRKLSMFYFSLKRT